MWYGSGPERLLQVLIHGHTVNPIESSFARKRKLCATIFSDVLQELFSHGFAQKVKQDECLNLGRV
jgi:hypothetical protein